MTGKGDKPRPYNKSKFDQNFDRIFNKPKGEKKNAWKVIEFETLTETAKEERMRKRFCGIEFESFTYLA